MFAFRGLWVIDARTEELLFAKRFPSVERRAEVLSMSSSTSSGQQYTALPANDHWIASSALKALLSTTPESLRNTVWVRVEEREEDTAAPQSGRWAGTGKGNMTVKSSSTLGPFLFQRPTKELIGEPVGCYSTRGLFIVGLPLIAHVSPLSGYGIDGVASGVGVETSGGGTELQQMHALGMPGGMLDYPCITACQQMLLDYFTPFVSSVCIAGNPNPTAPAAVSLGLVRPQTHKAFREMEEQFQAVRQPDGAKSGFRLSRADDASMVTAPTTESPLLVVSLRAWQLALYSFVATYFPFGSSSFLPPPPVGLQAAIDRLSGVTPVAEQGVSTNEYGVTSPTGGSGGSSGSSGEADSADAIPSVVDLILRMERKREDDAFIIGDRDSALDDRHHGGRQKAKGSSSSGSSEQHASSKSNLLVPPGHSEGNLLVSVVEDISCRMFGPNVPSITGVVTSLYATRPAAAPSASAPERSGKKGSTSRTQPAEKPEPKDITFVVLGLSSQASCVLTSPEVTVVHHRLEKVNDKQKLFGKNTSASSAVSRHSFHASSQYVFLEAKDGISEGPLSAEADGSGKVLFIPSKASSSGGESIGGSFTGTVGTRATSGRQDSSPSRMLSTFSPGSPQEKDADRKLVEATFIQAYVEPDQDSPSVRLLQIPSCNNGKLASATQGDDTTATNCFWRESAHRNVFAGKFEVIPILFRGSDKLHVDELRATQLLVEIKLDLELDLSPHVPVEKNDKKGKRGSSKGVQQSAGSSGETNSPGSPTLLPTSTQAPPTVVHNADAPYPQAMMEHMTVRIDFHNKTTIVPDTIEVSTVNPTGPRSVRMTSPSQLEWTLPKSVARKHGTAFELSISCVINSPVERVTTQVPVSDVVASAAAVSNKQGGTGNVEKATIQTVDFGDVPALQLEGPVRRGQGAVGNKAHRLYYKCPIPLASASLDFEMMVPDQRAFLLPCDVLDTSAFADAIGVADARLNPYGAGSIQGGCSIARSVIVRSSSATVSGNPLAFEQEGQASSGRLHPYLSTGSTDSTGTGLPALHAQNLAGYVIWNASNDGGFHLPHLE